MAIKLQSIAPFYEGWQFTNQRMIERIGALSTDQLGLRAAPDLWPIWAITAHLAGARVYWLCAIFKEPGAERAPFVDAAGYGWEDDPAHPRGPSELTFALDASWTIVEECLQRWTPGMLQEEFRRESGGQIEIHTRQAVLMRLLTHDAYHGGEISQTLGMNGLKELDLWAPRTRTAATPQ
jgi:uncharacterized damage-inducible protein DinB